MSEKILEEIIQEYSKLQNGSATDMGNGYIISSFRGLGNIYITEKIYGLIRKYAQLKYKQLDIQGWVSKIDFQSIVRRSFAFAFEEENFPDNFQACVKEEITKRITWVLDENVQDYIFGCTLFSFKDCSPFKIGPVLFEPRETWLERKSQQKRSVQVLENGYIERFDDPIETPVISDITKCRVLAKWKGQSLANCETADEEQVENQILEAIGNCFYVCSVQVAGHSDKAGLDKALMAANLALTFLSLIFKNSSRALKGFNLLFEREERYRCELSFGSDGRVFGGTETQHGSGVGTTSKANFNEHFEKLSAEQEAAGEIINWWLKPNNNELHSVMTQAMVWFCEGCRETIDLKAIVSFASCLDVLSCGKMQKGIKELIEARLGVDEDTIINLHDENVKTVLKEIYDGGRIRFVHGPINRNNEDEWNDRMGHDWSETRGQAEFLARLCLISCLTWMAEHPEEDDPHKLRGKTRTPSAS